MQIIKVKYLKGEVPNGREYTFYSNEPVKLGDLVWINSSTKGIVTEVDVPESEIEAFKDRVKTIVGVGEKVYKIIDIKDASTHATRIDGRYPLRIGRTVKNPMMYKGAPMVLEYIANADGSDYSNRTLRTSMVVGVEKVNNRIKVETMNSIYIFEKVGD